MASPTQVWRSGNFSGGRNTHSSDYDVSPSESPDDNNMDGRIIGSIRRRLGFKKFSETQYGLDSTSGLYRFYRSNGDKYILVFNGGILWSGIGIPPDDSQIKTNLTRSTFMTFSTVHDWCYFSNYLDEIHRYDGTNVIQAGLPPLSDSFPFFNDGWYFPPAIATKDDDGEMENTSFGFPSAIRLYTFRFRYGRLGKSNLPTLGYDFGKENVLNNIPDGVSPHPNQVRSEATILQSGLGQNAIRIQSLQLRPLGLTPVPLTGAVPTHIQIYRTLVSETLQDPSDFITTTQSNTISYYFVDEVPLDNTTENNTYIDRFSDVEILDRYEGHVGVDIDRLLPKARYLVEHRNRLFFLNCRIETDDPPDYPNRLWWSEINHPDRIEDQLDVYPEDGDIITGGISFANTMLIFKRTKTYMLLGSSPSNFEIRIVNPGIGCVAPRTIAVLDNRVIFLGQDGVYAFDGANFTRISEKIRPDILGAKHDSREFSAGGTHNGRYSLSFEEEA